MTIIHIKFMALKFLKRVNYNLSINNLCNYVDSIGWKVVFFNTEKGDSLITELNLEDECSKKDGFVYDENFKFIFINGNLKYSTLVVVLLHEIAHIILNHKTSIKSDEQQEIETQTFANYILTHNKNKFRITIILISTLCILLIGGIVWYNINANYAVAPTNKTTQSQLNKVYITPTGNKYHKANCIHIYDTAIEVDIEKAKKSYAPCMVCIR